MKCQLTLRNAKYGDDNKPNSRHKPKIVSLDSPLCLIFAEQGAPRGCIEEASSVHLSGSENMNPNFPSIPLFSVTVTLEDKPFIFCFEHPTVSPFGTLISADHPSPRASVVCLLPSRIHRLFLRHRCTTRRRLNPSSVVNRGHPPSAQYRAQRLSLPQRHFTLATPSHWRHHQTRLSTYHSTLISAHAVPTEGCAQVFCRRSISTDLAPLPTHPVTPDDRNPHHLALASIVGPNTCVTEHYHQYLQFTKLVETRCSPSYINGMVTHMESINAVEKLLEIDAIGFGFVKRIPKRAVKQSMMKQLARAYDVDTNTLIVDVENIRINSVLIGKALGIRDGESSSSRHQSTVSEKDNHRATRFHVFLSHGYQCATGKFQKVLHPGGAENVLMPNKSTNYIPVAHPSYFDVTDPSRFNWAHKIFKWLGLSIEKFQSKNHKTCGGCMFALLRLQHDPLDHCREQEPWVIAWTAAKLEKKAANVLAEVALEIGRDRARNQPPLNKADGGHTRIERRISSFRNRDARTGTRKKLSIVRGRSCDYSTTSHEGPSCNERYIVPSDSDKDDDVPIAQRRPRPVVLSDSDKDDDVPIAQRRRRLFQDDLNPNGEHVNEEDSAFDPHNQDPIKPSSALVKSMQRIRRELRAVSRS
ncbi:hypothetical protein Ahy_B03g065757 [Arachis hypogaea]|uniref:Uncharacterized protein n=1 Tax=Arachis hypogaea TaxID=3818 RepID=A0A445A2B5_ARAHY|nr:hypothetical protein Ahy_B03g065757 [Arachis hypogaea]